MNIMNNIAHKTGAEEFIINPATIIQSTVALAIAITCTDAVRDAITAIHPTNHQKIAMLRVLAAIIVVIITIFIIRYFGRVPHCAENYGRSNSEHFTEGGVKDRAAQLKQFRIFNRKI